ncbi:hypothetical protein D3C76_1084970 [compost metagenome]
MNRMVAAMNSFTSPNRRLSQPVRGRAMALLTANEVMTQVPCSALAPRLPAMVDSDTLAMVVSSTCMKHASDRPMVASARFGGLKWLFWFICGSYQRCAVRWGPLARLARISRSISSSAEASCCW